MLRGDERVPQRDIALGVRDAVQDHVDAAHVVRRQVDLLTVDFDVRVARRARRSIRLQKERSRSARGVVYLIHVPLLLRREAREKLRHLLRREELPSALPRVRRVHLEQILVRVPEKVDRVLRPLELHLPDLIQNRDDLLDPLVRAIPQLRTLHVKVAEKALEVRFALRPLRGVLNMPEDFRKLRVHLLRASPLLGILLLVSFFVDDALRFLQHVAEKLRRLDEVPVLTRQVLDNFLV